ncbi:MAG: hypothetical protein GX197_05900 [Firmicutes bacterium]|nr:hypothetical protein [Bacillota bacterium]
MRKMDDIFEKLPHALEDGLKDLKFTEEMRQNVLSQLNKAATKAGPQKKKHFWQVAVALIVLLGCIGVAGLWSTYRNLAPPVTSPNFTEIEALDIDLDGKEPLELVNTWRVREPDRTESLMAIVWTRNARGQLSVVSTHPMEGQEFLPLVVLPAPRRQGNLVVIASTDGEKQIFYSILGYENGRVVEYPGKYIEYPVKKMRNPREINLVPVIIDHKIIYANWEVEK